MTRPGSAVLPALLLLASGVSALVYQVLWVRQLSLIVGVDVHAVTAGVAAFFGGLALGGWLIGRRAERAASPWRLYAGLEAGIALLGTLATILLAHAAAPFVGLEEMVGPLAWLLPVALVAVPAFLMGGTVPVMMRVVAPQQTRIGGAGGALYASNTVGAIAGALLASFILIPWLGIRGTAFAAAAVNLAVAAAAFMVLRGARESRDAVQPASPAAGARAALIVYAIAGGVALGYEVVWTQAITQFTSTRAFAFAVVLATYLVGLALGSAVFARRADRLREPWVVFGLLLVGAGAVALLEVALLGRWIVVVQTWAEAAALALGGGDLAGMSARFAVAAACIVLLPTLLLGAAFPVALRLGADAGRAARDTGAIIAFNTLGGIAGTVLAGFVLLPALGLVRTLAALALIAAALGIYAAWRAPAGRTPRTFVLAAGVVVVICAALTPPDRLAGLLAAARGGELVFYDESPGGTVAIVETAPEMNQFRRLYIQGVSNSGDAMPSLRYMRLQSLLPLLIHGGEPHSALVIGLGTGITAGALLPYPLEKRVVAELLPAVVRGAPLFRGNYGAPADSRIDIRLRDGRRELLRSDERYDLVTLEPPPPSAAGVANLYSTEFYRLAAARLAPRGVVAQWLPLATQNDEDTRSLVRSFLDAFPHATLWTTELHEALLIGSADPIELDWARIAARFGQPDVAAALREVGVGSPAALLATWVTDRAGLERYAAGAPAVTDDRPRIEYAAWVRPREIVRVLPALLAEATWPEIRGTDAAATAAVRDERERLRRFYLAGLHAYTGDRAGWAREMQQVLQEDPGNPYYRWFGGVR